MQTVAFVRRGAPWALGLAAAAGAWFVALRPAEGGGARDGVPSGAVAFFGAGTACPPGWAPAEAAAGRLVVGVVDPAAVGRTVNAPLGDREDRTHTHAFTGSVTVSPRALAALDGPNRQGAAARAYALSGRTAPATAAVPFVQLRACVKR